MEILKMDIIPYEYGADMAWIGMSVATFIRFYLFYFWILIYDYSEQR